MSNNNICFYKQVEKIRNRGCNLKTKKLLDCVLIGVCVVTRLTALCNFVLSQGAYLRYCFLCIFRSQGTEGPSGFGFELTFRLKREPGETNPPTWPATLMQALARYVFQTGL